MNILLVGAGGLLGSCLMQVLGDALGQKKWNLTGLNRSALDITDHAAVVLELAKHKPDIIINAAAYTAVEQAQADAVSADAVNNLAVRHLAQVAHRLNAVLIHFSTDYVFDGRQARPYVESDLTHPLNTYGQTKLAGELAIREEAEKYFIIRTSWLFGERGNNFFSKMVGLLQSSRELNIVSDQVGGPTYVYDLAAAVEALLQRCSANDPLPVGVYHYAGYPFVSWYEFAKSIQIALGGQHSCSLHPIVSAVYRSQVIRPLNSRLDTARLEALLGVPPSNWQQALSSMISQRGIG